jgi:hypothetical protein
MAELEEEGAEIDPEDEDELQLRMAYYEVPITTAFLIFWCDPRRIYYFFYLALVTNSDF